MADTYYLGMPMLIVGMQQPHIPINGCARIMAKALTGVRDIDFTGVTEVSLSAEDWFYGILRVVSTTSASTILVRQSSKAWFLINTTNHAVTVKVAGQSSPPAVAAGETKYLVCDGYAVTAVSI